MAVAFASDVEREVWKTLQRLNSTWLQGEVEHLEDVLHERMVIVPPGFAQRIEGRAACAEGYEQFARSAKVRSYSESDAHVDVRGATAVVTYRYELTYEMEDATFQDSGHDLYVFVHEDGRWQALWRTLVSAVVESP